EVPVAVNLHQALCIPFADYVQVITLIDYDFGRRVREVRTEQRAAWRLQLSQECAFAIEYRNPLVFRIGYIDRAVLRHVDPFRSVQLPGPVRIADDINDLALGIQMNDAVVPGI